MYIFNHISEELPPKDSALLLWFPENIENNIFIVESFDTNISHQFFTTKYFL